MRGFRRCNDRRRPRRKTQQRRKITLQSDLNARVTLRRGQHKPIHQSPKRFLRSGHLCASPQTRNQRRHPLAVGWPAHVDQTLCTPETIYADPEALWGAQDRLAVLFEVTPTFGTFDTSEDELDLCFLMTEDSTVLTPAGLPSSALKENQRFLGSPISPAAILCERWMNRKRDAVVDFARSDAGPAYARKIVYYTEGGKPQQYMDMLWNVQATVDWNSGSVPTSDK
ncbi:hypothetical protein [Tritonibacter mobilis]|uniref:Uncharacterized protein n=1 Tax=Tritonibacter mobilis F1926 TaxID=1265309 RepID=A0A1B1A907_9RHOB|nr:hypothetical protein [Tritonibacter mobilis]ANP43007.1 hypothetical protein K529_019825 [Tritonibacter mobilis F1926]